MNITIQIDDYKLDEIIKDKITSEIVLKLKETVEKEARNIKDFYIDGDFPYGTSPITKAVVNKLACSFVERFEEREDYPQMLIEKIVEKIKDEELRKD